MLEYNIYCDESCHLENDQKKVMVLGALSCPKDVAKSIFKRIREIKKRHSIKLTAEIKWHKVSDSKFEFYKDLVDLYFDITDLGFRAVVIEDKSCLDHKKFNQTHDEFYYKMYFDLLKVLFNPEYTYNIYLDIKDTNGGFKVRRLHDILCTNIYDLKRQIIKQIQLYPSDEIELIQLCDLLIGAIGYNIRGLHENEGKIRIIRRIQERSGYSLKKTTLLKEQKMNILIWEPSNRNCD
jgi:hypothetical protein